MRALLISSAVALLCTALLSASAFSGSSQPSTIKADSWIDASVTDSQGDEVLHVWGGLNGFVTLDFLGEEKVQSYAACAEVHIDENSSILEKILHEPCHSCKGVGDPVVAIITLSIFCSFFITIVSYICGNYDDMNTTLMKKCAIALSFIAGMLCVAALGTFDAQCFKKINESVKESGLGSAFNTDSSLGPGLKCLILAGSMLLFIISPLILFVKDSTPLTLTDQLSGISSLGPGVNLQANPLPQRPKPNAQHSGSIKGNTPSWKMKKQDDDTPSSMNDL